MHSLCSKKKLAFKTNQRHLSNVYNLFISNASLNTF